MTVSMPRLIAHLWIAFVVVWWVWALFNRKAYRSRSWGGRAWRIRLSILVAVVLLVQLERISGLGRWLLRLGQPAPSWQWLGVALCLAGFLLAIWARLYLGSNWGMPMSLRQQHELVTSGPYARVRHPIYSGILLAGVGTVLALGTLWLPLVVLGCVSFVFSARAEERMLRELFPQDYPAYQARTRMVIPYLL